MQVYIHTSPQCQVAEVSQLPERGAGERRLVATLAQQHLRSRIRSQDITLPNYGVGRFDCLNHSARRLFFS